MQSGGSSGALLYIAGEAAMDVLPTRGRQSFEVARQ